MTATDPAEAMPGLLYLDPDFLEPDPDNVRTDLRDMDAMTASVKELGVLVPLTVRPTPGGPQPWRVVFGHRRREAAIRAGVSPIPCLVRTDLTEGTGVASQLAENISRTGLTAVEEAKGYEQLSAFGWDDSTIAAGVGTTPEVVGMGLRLALAPKAMKVATRYNLPLDLAAGLAEFDDDEVAMDRLTTTAGKDADLLPHTLSQLRQDRDDRIKRDALVAGLGKGVAVLSEMPEWRYRKGHPVRLDQLRSDKGGTITAARHRKCPGAAAFVLDRGTGPVAIYACTDPLANGHTDEAGKPLSSSAAPPEEKAAATEERKEVVANNKAWRAADPVRKAWLDELYVRAKPPKGALRYAVEAILSDTRLLADYGEMRQGAIVGVVQPLDVPDAMLPLVLMRQACAAMERSMTVDAWRRPPTGTAAYLRFIATAGYVLSDVERVAIAAADARNKPKAKRTPKTPEVVVEEEAPADVAADPNEEPVPPAETEPVGPLDDRPVPAVPLAERLAKRRAERGGTVEPVGAEAL